MDRIEASKRVSAAIDTLLMYGWRRKEIETFCNGLYRDDMVEALEREVVACHAPTPN